MKEIDFFHLNWRKDNFYLFSFSPFIRTKGVLNRVRGIGSHGHSTDVSGMVFSSQVVLAGARHGFKVR